MPTPLAEAKPRLRGRIHEVAFVASLPAGVALVALAPTTTARVVALVYALSLSAVFGSSAAYHRGTWSTDALRRMKRLDHSMIYVLIAGSYTPVTVLVLDGAWSVVLLSAVWVGALVGIALKLARIDGLRAVTATLYVVLGWLAVLALPQLVRELPAAGVALMLVGGVLYTGGAIVLALRRPDPDPAVFGYHEVWHALMTAAAACHWVMILVILRATA